MEGADLLRRIWDVYCQSHVDPGDAGERRGWVWIGPGGELQVCPGAVSSGSYLCIITM